jgi:hypothetical protein
MQQAAAGPPQTHPVQESCQAASLGGNRKTVKSFTEQGQVHNWFVQVLVDVYRMQAGTGQPHEHAQDQDHICTVHDAIWLHGTAIHAMLLKLQPRQLNTE